MILSMSAMGLKKSLDGGLVGGWGELYLVLFWILGPFKCYVMQMGWGGGCLIFWKKALRRSDMPHGTDRPYPIRILAFFEMIRPYHVGIRILGNLREENCKACV